MADKQIEEAEIIAWVDGELDEATAARVAQIVAADPALTELADRHRRMKTRFAAAFGGLADAPVAMPRSAPVISLAAVRAERRTKAMPLPSPRRWALPGAIAASLVVGVLAGHQIGGATGGVRDQAGALALATPIAHALEGQLAGEAGPVRVALSFRDHSGDYCRSFSATHLAGIACRENGGWRLRYAAPGAQAAGGDYHMAGADVGQAEVVATMIAGEPLDATAEREARATGWH